MAATRKKSKQPASKAQPLDVVCPQCRGVFCETTEHYDAARQPNTSMCRLKEPYRSWGWAEFHSPPPGEGMGHMECPGCGAALVTATLHLETREQQPSKSRARRMGAQVEEEADKPEEEEQS